MTTKNPVFYDFEASGLDGVPIEIGWAFLNTNGGISSVSHLIKPPEDWHIEDVWDETAEALHGISRAELAERGQLPFAICRAMNAALADRDLYADGPFDGPWMQQLFEAGGLEPTFRVHQILADIFIAKEAQKAGLATQTVQDLQARAERDSPRTHRAEPDARYLATYWNLTMGAVAKPS